MNNRTKGILCIISAAFCFALMNTFVRLSGDLPSVEKSFFRNLVAMVVALAVLLRSGGGFRIHKGCLPLLLLRSAFGTVGVLGNFYAVDHLLLANASLLNKMAPFFVLLFSWLVLKERMKPIQILLVLVAFAGCLFIIQPVPGNLTLLPSIVGFVGGMSAGFAYTMVRALGLRGERGTLIVFFFSTFSCAVTLPYLLFRFVPMTAGQLFMLLGAGVCAAGGQFSVTKAYTFAPGREISVYDYTQILFAALIGWFLFGQAPDGWNLVGYVLILAAAVVMFLYNNGKLERRSQP